jgi:hypothetical protein
MLNNLKYVLAGTAALGAAVLTSGSASAMPNGLSSDALASNVEQVRWVCGPYRCWWRPNYGYYGWGPRWRYGRRW